MKDHDGDKTGLPARDRRAGKACLTLEADCAPERNFLCQPDGSALPAPARKNPLHSLPKRRPLISREGMDRIPQNLSYSRATGRLASNDLGGQVDRWDPRVWFQIPIVIPIVSDPQNNRWSIPLRLAFCPNGGKLAYLGEDGAIGVLTGWGSSQP